MEVLVMPWIQHPDGTIEIVDRLPVNQEDRSIYSFGPDYHGPRPDVEEWRKKREEEKLREEREQRDLRYFIARMEEAKFICNHVHALNSWRDALRAEQYRFQWETQEALRAWREPLARQLDKKIAADEKSLLQKLNAEGREQDEIEHRLRAWRAQKKRDRAKAIKSQRSARKCPIQVQKPQPIPEPNRDLYPVRSLSYDIAAETGADTYLVKIACPGNHTKLFRVKDYKFARLVVNFLKNSPEGSCWRYACPECLKPKVIAVRPPTPAKPAPEPATAKRKKPSRKKRMAPTPPLQARRHWEDSTDAFDADSSAERGTPYPDAAERRLDYTRPYAHAYREQGRFGSHPSHDGYDDESDA
jgi:hypothetical protein